MMMKRYMGDRDRSVSIAQENYAFHAGRKDKAKAAFWTAVLSALDAGRRTG